ncbi:MAG: hypothetical protein ACK6EB_46820 [Planctomyces sp.]|jgi:hypothetical protein
MSTKTCTRCNGTGLKNTGVVHMGVPGLCYGCNGSGLQVWVCAAGITAELQAARDRHIAELHSSIAECEAGRAAGTIREKYYLQWTAEYKATLAGLAAVVEPAKRGEWRPSTG